MNCLNRQLFNITYIKDTFIYSYKSYILIIIKQTKAKLNLHNVQREYFINL